jgi:catechol 2,3-dioxygenase-like lactoylglutathione lyase family enzyme
MVTADIERLRNFYCDLLGFTVKFDGIVGGDLEAKIAEQWRLPPGAKVRTVILASRDGYTQIGLTSAVGAKVPVLQRRRDQPMTGGEHYMILAATNILPLIDKLRAAGVEFWRPTMSITGGHEAGIYDPDGTRIIIEEGGAP